MVFYMEAVEAAELTRHHLVPEEVEAQAEAETAAVPALAVPERQTQVPEAEAAG